MKTNKNLFIVIIMVSLILITGCQKRIDGSSEQRLKESIEEIKKGLSEEKCEKFEESLKLLAFEDLDLAELVRKGITNENYIYDIMAKVDGLTADQVIEKGEAIKEKREKEKKGKAKKEIDSLLVKKKESEQAIKELEKFKVLEAEFYVREISYMEIERIRLKVKNNTDKAISRAYFYGIYKNPEREVAWGKSEFDDRIEGGIEPGETKTLEMSPTGLTEFSTMDEHEGAELSVEVIRLDGPNGEKLWEKAFTEKDQQRLNELLEEYPELAPSDKKY